LVLYISGVLLDGKDVKNINDDICLSLDLQLEEY